MNNNDMLFKFTKLNKQGEIKEVIDNLNLDQIEILIKSLNNKLYNYSIELNKNKEIKKITK